MHLELAQDMCSLHYCLCHVHEIWLTSKSVPMYMLLHVVCVDSVLWIDNEIITQHMLCWVFMGIQVLCAFLLVLFASKNNEASAAMWEFILSTDNACCLISPTHVIIVCLSTTSMYKVFYKQSGN